jgi:hypothetical protein
VNSSILNNDSLYFGGVDRLAKNGAPVTMLNAQRPYSENEGINTFGQAELFKY